MDKNRQFAIVDSEGKIEAIILTRGGEFYCFEQLEDGPKNFKEAMEMYEGRQIVDLKLSTAETSSPQSAQRK